MGPVMVHCPVMLAWFPRHAHALGYCGYILTTPLVIVVDTYQPPPFGDHKLCSTCLHAGSLHDLESRAVSVDQSSCWR